MHENICSAIFKIELRQIGSYVQMWSVPLLAKFLM
jgi:hypothetical protein